MCVKSSRHGDSEVWNRSGQLWNLRPMLENGFLLFCVWTVWTVLNFGLNRSLNKIFKAFHFTTKLLFYPCFSEIGRTRILTKLNWQFNGRIWYSFTWELPKKWTEFGKISKLLHGMICPNPFYILYLWRTYNFIAIHYVHKKKQEREN